MNGSSRVVGALERSVGVGQRRVEILAAFECRYSDFDMMAESAIGWDQKYDHIGRGGFDGRLSQVVLNTLQVGRERWNPGIMQRGSAPEGCWVVGLPIVAEGSLHLRGRHVGPGQPLLVGPCDDIAFTATGATDLAMAVMPVDQIEHWMQIRRGAPGLDRKYLDRPWKVAEREIVRRGAILARLLRLLLTSAGDASPDALADIEGQVVDVVLGMVPSTDVTEPLHRRARVAMKLRDMLMGHVETPPSISVMCETLGVRERTLSLACVEAFGRPPKAMLLEIRLNAVRRALVHPTAERTVTAVASRLGFSHFGNFAAEYKRQFAELPSVTLAKALGTSQPVAEPH
ncbi:helix-turn-helix domain-containing protein [Mesorhizobium ventifaucium]|uniref:HTH araC/xylS-type domain-containing protein n=1 Tax=Mesorhizobium ventifaucium TaxID=666020 RepID=A0ABM9DYH7_9HYPH|nr:helix-turn-helix domain-containing protein [Mesorhizobium ventifaucium]CAH2401838.1 HTH araC/xylS-type domain-containing protein [Mesorhizobium ventifaucium]